MRVQPQRQQMWRLEKFDLKFLVGTIEALMGGWASRLAASLDWRSAMSWSGREREVLEQSGLHVFVEPDQRGSEGYGRLLDETYVIIAKRGLNNWTATQNCRDSGRLLFREEGLALAEAIAPASNRRRMTL